MTEDKKQKKMGRPPNMGKNALVRRNRSSPHKKHAQRKDTWLPTPDQLKDIKRMASIGMPLYMICADLGISKSCWEDKTHNCPELKQAYEEGRTIRNKRAYTCFFQQAFPVDENGKPKKGDPKLMIFYMKTQLRWREPTKKIHIDSSGEAPIIEYAIREITGQKSKEKKGSS